MSTFTSPFGYEHPNRDKRDMCPYCKNEDTQSNGNPTDLAELKRHYDGREFRALSCSNCNASFHFPL